MSYKLTEAERKHIATVEDTTMYLVKNDVEGATPAVALHLEDGDKLNLDVDLPSYKFEVTETDDRLARIKLIDTTSPDNENEILCEGLVGTDCLTGERGPLGIGWRYCITFTKDADNYVNGIKFMRKNDGAEKVLTFRNLSSLTIKDLVVDTTLTVKGEASFENDVTISNDSDDVKANLTVEGRVTSEEVKTTTADVENIIATNTQTTNVLTENVTIDSNDASDRGDVNIRNTDVLVSASSITTDETADVNFAAATVTNLTAVNEDVSKLAAGEATVQKLVVTDEMQVGDITINTVKSNEVQTSNLTAKTEAGTGKVSADNIVANKAKINTSVVGAETVTDLTAAGATITNEIVASSEITNADITSANIGAADVESANIEGLTAGVASISTLNVDNGISTLGGNIAVERGSTMEMGNINDELVFVSKGIGDKKDPDHYNVRARIDDREVVLLTGDDVEALGLDNVVDRSTNQEIAGVKVFNNAIYTNDGIIARDDDGNEFQVITRGPDINDTADEDELYVDNPEYAEARKDASDYQAALNKYNEVRTAKSDATTKYYNKIKTAQELADSKTAYEKRQTEFTAYKVAHKLLTEGIAASEKEYVDTLNVAKSTMVQRVDYYNDEANTIQELSKVHVIYEGDEYAQSVYDEIDEIYSAANAKVNANEQAQTYLARLNAAFTPANLASLVSAIDSYTVAGTSKKITSDVTYRNIVSLKTFCDVAQIYAKEENPALNVLDVYAKALCADPTFENLPEYRAGTVVEGVYKDDGTFALVTTIAIDGVSTTVVLRPLTHEGFLHTNQSQIMKFHDGAEGSHATITCADDVVVSYLKAKTAEYEMPAYITEMVEAKEAYVNLKATLQHGAVFAEDTTQSSEVHTVMVNQCRFGATVDGVSFNKPYDATLNLLDDIVGRISNYFGDFEDRKISSLKYNQALPGSVLDNAKVLIQECTTADNTASRELESSLVTFDELVAEYVAMPMNGDSQQNKTYAGTVAYPDLDEVGVNSPIPNTKTYYRFIAGSIKEKKLAPGVDTVMTVGNDEDELHLRSEGIEGEGGSKDDHIQATIDGHYHKIANLDDLDNRVTNDMFRDDLSALNTVPVTTKIEANEKRNEVVVSKNTVIKSVFTEAEKKTAKDNGVNLIPVVKDSDEKMFGIKGGEGIKVDVEDNNIVITSSENENIQTALNEIDVTSKVDIKIDKSGEHKYNLELKNVYQRDAVSKADVVDAYSILAADGGNKNQIPTAVQVKVLTDNALAEAMDAKKTIALRVPAAPKNTGDYLLKANVSADEAGNLSSIYSWDGSASLPDTSEAAVDDVGQPLQICTVDNPVEYGLKLRIVNEIEQFSDGSVRINRIPQLVWSKIK